MAEPQYLTVHHGVWHFLRRVPIEYERLDTRGNVKLSSKVKVATDRTGISEPGRGLDERDAGGLETGARPSEIVNPTAQRIVLDVEVPYIRIQAEGRILKTEHSERDIPQVGHALEAMKRYPHGFPRYFDKGCRRR